MTAPFVAHSTHYNYGYRTLLPFGIVGENFSEGVYWPIDLYQLTAFDFTRPSILYIEDHELIPETVSWRVMKSHHWRLKARKTVFYTNSQCSEQGFL